MQSKETLLKRHDDEFKKLEQNFFAIIRLNSDLFLTQNLSENEIKLKISEMDKIIIPFGFNQFAKREIILE